MMGKCCLCGKSFELTDDNMCYCPECIDKLEAAQFYDKDKNFINLTKGDMVTLSKQGIAKYPDFKDVPLFVSSIDIDGIIHATDLLGVHLYFIIKDVNPYFEGQEV